LYQWPSIVVPVGIIIRAHELLLYADFSTCDYLSRSLLSGLGLYCSCEIFYDKSKPLFQLTEYIYSTTGGSKIDPYSVSRICPDLGCQKINDDKLRRSPLFMLPPKIKRLTNEGSEAYRVPPLVRFRYLGRPSWINGAAGVWILCASAYLCICSRILVPHVLSISTQMINRCETSMLDCVSGAMLACLSDFQYLQSVYI
jgi:hypothetical protein